MKFGIKILNLCSGYLRKGTAVVSIVLPFVYHGFAHFTGTSLSKGNQASHPKFERPIGKILKSNFFYLGQELVRPAHLKAQ